MNKEDLISFFNSFYKEEQRKTSDSYYEELEEKAKKLLAKKTDNTEITFNKSLNIDEILKYRIINCGDFEIIQRQSNLAYLGRNICANIKESKEIYNAVTKQYSKIHKDLDPHDKRFVHLKMANNGTNFFFTKEELYECLKYFNKFGDLNLFV